MQFKSTLLILLSPLFSFLPAHVASATDDIQLHDGVLFVGAGADSIPSYAFAGYATLTEVRFAERPDLRPLHIGDYALMGCTALQSLELPDFVVSLGEGCFRDCLSLRELRLPSRLTSTPRYMAAWCVNLRHVSLPASLKKIGAHSFAYCGALAGITLPDGLENIENNAFSRAESLTHIKIPDSVTALESYAFSDCFNLKECTLPANRSMLGELIFSGCEALEELVEPSPVPPPFDCDSFIFEPEDTQAYRRCRLTIEPSAIPLYREAPGWRLFF